MSWYRVSTLGHLGTSEKWSTNMSFGVFGISPDTPNQADTDGLLASILDGVNTNGIPTYLRALLSPLGTLDGFRVERRAEDESILNVAEGLFGSPSTGSGTTSKTPQDSCVLSLRTSTPGPTGRGRLYWPALGASLSSSFQLTTPTPAQAVADAKTWLSAIGDYMNDYYTSISSALSVVLAVRSVKNHVCRDVVQVQVGSILDTQRRRREDIPETYASVSYP